MNTEIPEGFVPFKDPTGFIGANGPLYGRWDAGRIRLGFRVEERHCNPGMIVHGGMMATFADMLLAFGSRFQLKADPGFLPTVNLTCDYLAPSPLGAWVEGEAEIVRATRNLLFAQGKATADGKAVLRANAIFKLASGGTIKAGDIPVADMFDFATD